MSRCRRPSPARPAFGDALLREGIDAMLTGDVDTGRAMLRDYIKATADFENLAETTDNQDSVLWSDWQ